MPRKPLLAPRLTCGSIPASAVAYGFGLFSRLGALLPKANDKRICHQCWHQRNISQKIAA